ncbi:hypothetical protein RDI58_024183 [Solanum bulbocastanum]|uniref:Uncharacterized protein n=1 Tax=Solanum bulbocastanum TaxID=147425 RepID=A0AAN8T2I6_SOLBU
MDMSKRKVEEVIVLVKSGSSVKLTSNLKMIKSDTILEVLQGKITKSITSENILVITISLRQSKLSKCYRFSTTVEDVSNKLKLC